MRRAARPPSTPADPSTADPANHERSAADVRTRSRRRRGRGARRGRGGESASRRRRSSRPHRERGRPTPRTSSSVDSPVGRALRRRDGPNARSGGRRAGSDRLRVGRRPPGRRSHGRVARSRRSDRATSVGHRPPVIGSASAPRTAAFVRRVAAGATAPPDGGPGGGGVDSRPGSRPDASRSRANGPETRRPEKITAKRWNARADGVSMGTRRRPSGPERPFVRPARTPSPDGPAGSNPGLRVAALPGSISDSTPVGGGRTAGPKRRGRPERRFERAPGSPGSIHLARLGRRSRGPCPTSFDAPDGASSGVITGRLATPTDRRTTPRNIRYTSIHYLIHKRPVGSFARGGGRPVAGSGRRCRRGRARVDAAVRGAYRPGVASRPNPPTPRRCIRIPDAGVPTPTGRCRVRAGRIAPVLPPVTGADDRGRRAVGPSR